FDAVAAAEALVVEAAGLGVAAERAAGVAQGLAALAAEVRALALLARLDHAVAAGGADAADLDHRAIEVHLPILRGEDVLAEHAAVDLVRLSDVGRAVGGIEIEGEVDRLSDVERIAAAADVHAHVRRVGRVTEGRRLGHAQRALDEDVEL